MEDRERPVHQAGLELGASLVVPGAAQPPSIRVRNIPPGHALSASYCMAFCAAIPGRPRGAPGYSTGRAGSPHPIIAVDTVVHCVQRSLVTGPVRLIGLENGIKLVDQLIVAPQIDLIVLVNAVG